MMAAKIRGKTGRVIAVALILEAARWVAFAEPTSEYATQVSALVQTAPPRITLGWPANPHAVNFKVYRKLVADPFWGSPLATLPSGALDYEDTNVTVGAAFEYQVEVLTDYYPYPNGIASQWLTAYGYCYAGIDAPLIENRGKIILLVDNTFTVPLSNELARLQQDLVGDGWTVLPHDVSRADSVPSVKALIQADYNADPVNVRSVFLFGHVPVPYSGAINPDGHTDHLGAWPADVYYGELDGDWPDNSVNVSSSESSRNYNFPNDGKFDPSELPSDMDLEVGRVDLANLPAFAPKTEQDLLRQYLDKDHNFRLGTLVVERRGLICDNFGDLTGEAPAACAWRNFATLCGSNTTVEIPAGQYFPTLATDSYLWSYGCGGGSFTKADGVGFTTDFAATDTRTVFTMLFGSYFGDWDSEDNFLRAPLATTTYGLTCAWGGYPHWNLHHMALGQTIGYSTRVSQNNPADGLYRTQNNQSPRGVHVALMGDPSLRLHPVLPPSGLVNSAPGTATLAWTASPDTVLGYHVYRAPGAAGPFTRLTPELLTGTSFTDTDSAFGDNTYLVRAIKRETSGSGTYLNPSQGIFLTLNVTQAVSSCAPGPLGLVGWWPGDGNTQDIQGTNYGTPQNGVAFTAGQVASGFSFDGVDDLVTVGNKFAALTNNFTMTFWANPTASRASTPESITGSDGLSGQRYAIFPAHGSTDYGLDHSGWGVSVGTNGVSVFEYGNTFIPAILVYDTTVSGWTHIAVVCSNKVPQLYLDGVLKRVKDASELIPHPSADLSGSFGYYQGGLDEVALYNRPLTATEIQALASAGSGGLCKQIQITSIISTPTNQAQLTIQGRTGTIAVEVSTDFLNWTQVGLVTNSTGSVTYLDPNSSVQVRRFYRAVIR